MDGFIEPGERLLSSASVVTTIVPAVVPAVIATVIITAYRKSVSKFQYAERENMRTNHSRQQ